MQAANESVLDSECLSRSPPVPTPGGNDLAAVLAQRTHNTHAFPRVELPVQLLPDPAVVQYRPAHGPVWQHSIAPGSVALF